MTVVKRRAQPHADRAGDPLDGLVNMFDVGLVLAVAFMLGGVGLSSVLDKHLTGRGRPRAASIAIRKDQQLEPVHPGQRRVPVSGDATSVGQVYRLANGQLVYVAKRP